MTRHDPARLDAAASPAMAADAVPVSAPSMAAMMATQAVQDGEVILLVLKPSRWFVVLSSLRFLAVAFILAMLAHRFDERLPLRPLLYYELACMASLARLMWGTLTWMGRLYVLTDRRVLAVGGVVRPESRALLLRDLERMRRVRSTRERLFRLGTLLMESPGDQVAWQMIRRPLRVMARIEEARRRVCGEGGAP